MRTPLFITRKAPRMRGYTLLEMIIAVGLFTVVMTITMSAYLTLISLDRRARATNDVVTNLSFVVDSMSRSIRAGNTYQCAGGNCPGGRDSFTFVSEQSVEGVPQTITYLLKTDGNNRTVGMCTGSCTSSSASSITDPRITIDTLMFYVQGVGIGDQQQPRVTFTIKGSIKPDIKSLPVDFTIESSATQRLLEI